MIKKTTPFYDNKTRKLMGHFKEKLFFGFYKKFERSKHCVIIKLLLADLVDKHENKKMRRHRKL